MYLRTTTKKVLAITAPISVTENIFGGKCQWKLCLEIYIMTEEEKMSCTWISRRHFQRQMQMILIYILLCCSYEFIQYKVCRLSELLARNPVSWAAVVFRSITPKGSVQGTAGHPLSKAGSPVKHLAQKPAQLSYCTWTFTTPAWGGSSPVPQPRREERGP